MSASETDPRALQDERAGDGAAAAAPERPGRSVTIEFAPGLASPVAGRLVAPGSDPRAFSGYAELIAALEAWRGAAAGAPTGARGARGQKPSVGSR